MKLKNVSWHVLLQQQQQLLAVTAMAAGSIDKTGKADGYKVAVVDTTTPIYQEISKTYTVLPGAVVDVNKGTDVMKDFIAAAKEETTANANLTEDQKANLLEIAENLKEQNS